MSPTFEPVSEADLRRKTDRELLLLVRREMNRASELAQTCAATEAKARYSSAEKLLATVPLPEHERRELDRQLADIRISLGGVCLPKAY